MTEELEELWEEFEPGWWVSNLGYVRSPKGKIIQGKMRGHGDVYIQYKVDGDQNHRGLAVLVAENFVKMPHGECRLVIHKDGDKMNCRADNLEWYVPRRVLEPEKKRGRKSKEGE